MEEPTIENMLKALADAGKEVPKTATDEDIELMFIQLQDEQDKQEPEPVPDNGPVEDKPEPKKKTVKRNKADELAAVIANADPLKGDKDPVVIAWCRENLTAKQFEERYEGRKFTE